MPILWYIWHRPLATNYSGLNITSIKGKYVEKKDDRFAEYKINKTDLFEKILDIYYIKTR